MTSMQEDNEQPIIDVMLVNGLIATQFPQWKGLAIRPVTQSGWDNRTYHLGENMLVRLPSAAEYAVQVEKEHFWLPKLAPYLPLSIPVPLAMGEPTNNFPWKWSIYNWLNGNTAAVSSIISLNDFATTLAQFLIALQKVETIAGPVPSMDNFFRGGSLLNYDAETHHAIKLLKNKIDANTAIDLWENALSSSWQKAPVWVHGDISAENLLVQNGQLCAVIDFGMLAVGDPACDLVIAWTFLNNESREIFRHVLSYDKETWARARGWALWKAVITAAGHIEVNNIETAQCWHIIDEVLAEHKLITNQ